MKKSQRPTIADLRARKGQRQLSMLRVETLDEAAAAQQAGVDLLSVPRALTIFATPAWSTATS
jgi:3-methyl-2-oxobutanoate hydroxymethyltransferase